MLIVSQESFLDAFGASNGGQEVVLLIDEFIKLHLASGDVLDSCIRAFREAKNNRAAYAIRSIIMAGTFSTLHLNQTNTSKSY